ncbi:MAG: AAA family ATPase, partial [Myxococcaceae bacterium]
MFEQIDIHRGMMALWKRWPLCLSIFVSIMLLGLIVTIGTPKLYKSSATIRVNTDGPNAKFWPEATNFKLISAPEILLDIARDEKSVSINVIHADPKIAADLANQAVAAYLEQQTIKKDEAVKKEENLFNLQLKEAKDKLSISQKALSDYELKNQILNRPALENQIARVKHRIALFEDESVKAQTAGLIYKEQALQKAISKEQIEEMRLEKIILDRVPLKTEVEDNLRQYTSMKFKNILLTTEEVFSVSPAAVPLSLYQPNWKKNLILSLLFALLFSIGIALILEMIEQRTFKNKKHVEEGLKLPFLGISSSPEVRTNLLFMSPDKLLKSLLVTSTETSKNLAVSMAESGNRVLLVDCNFKEFSKLAGLSNLVIGESQLSDIITRSETKNLDLMASGQMPPLKSGLFKTNKFLEIFEELKKRYDKIIFDSPDLSLGAQVDGTVLVVQAGVTLRDTA